MTRIAKNYGQVTVAKGKHGELILPLPRSACRDFGIRIGDTIIIKERKAGGFWLRLYRRTATGWVRLLPGRQTRTMARPR